MNEVSLRGQLTAIRDKTANSGAIEGSWAENAADSRRVRDEQASGRSFWKSAHASALSGLSALDRGEFELAAAQLTDALWMYIGALEKQMRPESKKILSASAKKRGRPKGTTKKSTLTKN